MPTNTYVALDRVTVGTATPSVTFTGINQGYTDLVLVVSGYAITQDNSLLCRVGNGSVDTGNNYSTTAIRGDGSTAASNRFSNVDFMRLQANGGMGTSSSNIGTYIAHFMNYSNTTTNKTVLSRANQTGGLYPAVEAVVNLWRSTAAINVITVFPFTGASFGVGTTLSLYGIAATSVGAKATGGDIYTDSQYYYHVFDSTGTFTPLQSLSCDVLVVAGGGGAGSRWGAGGGAGGLLAFTGQSVSTAQTVTVGAGGAGGGGTTTGGIGSVGADSQFGGLTLVKGGGFGLRWLSAQNLGAAGTGGSGGGATSTANGTTSSAGAATSGQGFAGGGSSDNSAGGGGAGGAGAAGTSLKSGDGGIGSATYSSWGLATGIGQNVNGTYYLAGGGGGGTASSTIPGGSGGLGGGGNGNNGTATNNPAGNGLIATGGGGGGAGNNGDSASVYGGNGGSGVVIVRYAK